VAYLSQIDPHAVQRGGVTFTKPAPPYELVEREASGAEGDAGFGKQGDARRVGCQHTKQQVFGTDPRVREGEGLVLRAGHCLACIGGEALEHDYLPPCFLCTACLLTPSAWPICCHDQPCRRALSTCSASSRSASRRSAATACSPTCGSWLVAAAAVSTASVTPSTYIDAHGRVNMS